MAKIPIRQHIDNGDGTLSVPLTKGRFAIIDAADAPLVAAYNWGSQGYSENWQYACRAAWIPGGPRPTIRMHRVILGITDPRVLVDHVNGNTLDNRRCNLRVASIEQNAANAKKRRGTKNRFKGVCYRRLERKWLAYVTCNKRRFHIGYFADEEEAARAYDAKALELHGPFAFTNFGRTG